MSSITLNEAYLNPILPWKVPSAQGHSDARTKVQCPPGGAQEPDFHPRACLAPGGGIFQQRPHSSLIKGAGIEPVVIIRRGVCLKFPQLRESRKLLRLRMNREIEGALFPAA